MPYAASIAQDQPVQIVQSSHKIRGPLLSHARLSELISGQDSSLPVFKDAQAGLELRLPQMASGSISHDVSEAVS